MSPWLIYFITRCDAIVGTADGLSIGSGILGICFAIGTIVSFCVKWDAVSSDDEQQLASRLFPVFRKCLKASVTICVISILVAVAVPKTKEMAAICIIPAIVNNEKIQDEAADVYTLCKEYLKKQVKLPAETQ
jgi:hypothetical protein